MIKGIIFDYDGVIGDTFDAVFRTTQKMAEHFGKSPMPTEKQVREGIVNWKKLYAEIGFTNEELDAVVNEFYHHMMNSGGATKLFDGAEELILSLRRRFRIAIVSNGDKRRIEKALESAGLLECFDVIVGLEAARHKPDPYQLNVCMAALELAPEETAFVGDAVEDILAGRDAKVAKIVAVTYGYHPEHMLAGADAYASSPEELLKILEGLQ